MTTFVSNAGRCVSGRARVSATGVLLAAGALLAVSIPTSAFAQTAPVCGPDIKEEVANAITALDGLDDATRLGREKELYAKYSVLCAGFLRAGVGVVFRGGETVRCIRVKPRQHLL